MSSTAQRAEVSAGSFPLPPTTDGLALVLTWIQPSWRILDAGCGPGAHLWRISAATQPGGVVIGLDNDPAALAEAAAQIPDLLATRQATLELGTLEAVPLPSASIDLAWSSAVFHHLGDVPRALAELRRVVRPGGIVAIQDADLTFSFPLLPWPPALEAPVRAAAVRAAAADHGGLLPGPLDLYVARKLPRYLDDAGFTNITVHPVTALDQGPVPEERVAEIRAWFLGPFARRIEPFMAPWDFARLQAAFTPADPSYVFTDPTAFMLRTSLVVSGQVAS